MSKIVKTVGLDGKFSIFFFNYYFTIFFLPDQGDFLKPVRLNLFIYYLKKYILNYQNPL